MLVLIIEKENFLDVSNLMDESGHIVILDEQENAIIGTNNMLTMVDQIKRDPVTWRGLLQGIPQEISFEICGNAIPLAHED